MLRLPANPSRASAAATSASPSSRDRGELSQPGPAGGEGVVIDQRQAFVFLQNEAGLADQPFSEVGQGTQISLPHRTEAAHGRRDTTVQGIDDHLGEFGAHPGRAFGVTVHQAGHRGPHHRGWGGRSLGDQVIPDQGLAEAPAARSVERDALSLGDSGRQAIDGRLRSHGLLDNLPRLGHPVTRRRGEDGLVPPLGDGREGLDRQRRAVKHHHQRYPSLGQCFSRNFSGAGPGPPLILTHRSRLSAPGCKFAPWVGRVLAQLALQQGTVYDIGRFTSARFGGVAEGVAS